MGFITNLYRQYKERRRMHKSIQAEFKASAAKRKAKEALHNSLVTLNLKLHNRKGE